MSKGKQDKQERKYKKRLQKDRLRRYKEEKVRCYHYGGDAFLFQAIYELEEAFQRIEVVLNADTISTDEDWKERRQQAVDIYLKAAMAVTEEFTRIIEGFLTTDEAEVTGIEPERGEEDGKQAKPATEAM